MNRYTYFTAIVLMFVAVLFFAGTTQAVSESDGHNHAAEAAGHAEHAEGHAKHEAPSLNPLELASDTAVWSLVIFIAVFGILGKFAFKPIAKALDERENGIVEKIASAQRINDEAKELLVQHQQKLDASRDEVRQILETARKDAQRVADDIVEKARAAAHQEHERAIKEIDSAVTLALQTIAERSATLAANLAGKMIRAEIKPEQHRDLIQTALNDFAKS